MENMRFKVGDRVRIKSLDWYNKNKDEFDIVSCEEGAFVNAMTLYCDSILTIIDKTDNCYWVKENAFSWTDEMIEGLVEEENINNKWTGLKVELELSKSVIGVRNVESLYGERFMSGFVKAIIPPEGYICKDDNGNIINTTKIFLEKKSPKTDDMEMNSMKRNACQNCVFAVNDANPHCGLRGFRSDFNVEWCEAENDTVPNGYELQDDGYFSWVKKKKEYPKTFEECVHVLEGENRMSLEQMNTFRKLIDARNAYWKLYGEEMGLGKPWKLSIGTPIYYIYYNKTVSTIKNDYADDIQGNVILAFPTEEMRDAFYENFKELIESCKELL